MKKAACVVAILVSVFILGCDKESIYPSITGQIKQIVSPVTVPGLDTMYTVLVFADGRSYIFRGQCPVIIEEGKTFKISYTSYTNNNGEYQYSVFRDVQKVTYEPAPPPLPTERTEP
jgi:hypothetical protein